MTKRAARRKTQDEADSLKIPETRFKDCVGCRFYKPYNTLRQCNGCEIGENFEEIIEELDPYSQNFLSPSGGFYDDGD